MGLREKIIALSIKYDGEYFKILKAIKQGEEIEEINVDNCITIVDDIYPNCLKELKYPPFVLYYKGDINLISSNNMISVVGSRMPCDYAINATISLVNNNQDKIVVSGLAKGIDSVAHKTAYKTIGVLGCGIEYIYPYENKELFKRIEKEGLIISEYPFKVKPYSYHFPFRNRIIAALSNVVYVMQSSEKSGTVTTINEALELQKEIRVLPFSIYEQDGSYNNHLINDGALLIENSDLKIDK